MGYVTKKALIAWDEVCSPKYEGGLGLINLKIWNRSVIAKLCWDLAKKEDKLWIKWIHAYYLKGQSEWKMSNTASWMVQKIMSEKVTVDQVQQKQSKGKGILRTVYHHMTGRQQKPAWTCLMYSNAARPKAYIIMWLMMNQKLSTVDRLVRWGLEIEKTCVLCKNVDETKEHLFLQCQFARKLW